MSPSVAYTRVPNTSNNLVEDGDDILESLQNIPSNFDIALNGGTNRTFLSPKPPKTVDASLLDPETFRRLSVSTVSSVSHPASRGVSPHPAANHSEAKGIRGFCHRIWKKNEGLFLVTFSQLFGALMNVTARVLELEGQGMHPLQVLFARMSLTMVFCCSYMWWKKIPHSPFGAKGIRGLLVARGFTGFFGIFGMYYSLQYLPVADATVITFLAPSLASYGCYLYLQEPFSRSAQYASLISLLGVVLIARPTSFFSLSTSHAPSMPTNGTSTSSTSYDAHLPAPTPGQRLSAIAVALLGVVGSAFVFTIIRWIGHRAHPLISVNYFASFCTLVSAASLTLAQPLNLSSDLHFALPANLRQWGMLLFLGSCGFIMQFLLTAGLAAGGRGNGARATNMIYTNMLFALALDKLVFGQSPGWWSLGGSGLILGSALFVALQKQQSEQAVRTDEEHVGVRAENGTVEEEMAILRGREREAERGEEDDTRSSEEEERIEVEQSAIESTSRRV